MFEMLRQSALLLITPHCFENYFEQNDYFNGPCFRMTLSKFLSLLIIFGSLTVKFPQIFKILKKKSGQGINILSVILDITVLTIHMSYCFLNRFPLTSWGDSVISALQTSALTSLVLYYQTNISNVAIYLILNTGIFYILMVGFVPHYVIWTLESCVIPLGVSGKLIQAWTNFRNGNTGQLSAITIFILTLRSSARIFTTIQETSDTLVMVTYVTISLANCILLFQMLYYWNAEIKKKD